MKQPLLFTLVNARDEIDLVAATGWPVQRLPLVFRVFGEKPLEVEATDGLTHCNTVVAIYGDTNVDPRSGGVIGPASMIGEALGLKARTVRRYGETHLAFVHNMGGVYATHQDSLDHFKEHIHSTLVHDVRVKSGIRGATKRWKEK